MSGPGMPHGLEGRVAIVTGGGTGIGRAAAIAFARQGANVLIVGRRPEPLARTVAAGLGIHAVTADVTVEADARRIVDAAGERWGQIDIVVNNAGAFAAGPLEQVSVETVATLFGTNVLGPCNLVREALPWIKESRGSIVNVSSTHGSRAGANVSYYAASKAALEHLTRCWALELAPHGIRVNAVSPGPTETDMLSQSGLPADVVESVKEAEKAQIPLGWRDEPPGADPHARWCEGTGVRRPLLLDIRACAYTSLSRTIQRSNRFPRPLDGQPSL